ncbi:hypothetical protein LJC49_10065 [Ruminococcaceae bacterium OttesenSCG-928-I18]|nr:hypothetical protein [Ruminococcaceae bacterium OttesenSCG-928-I18]
MLFCEKLNLIMEILFVKNIDLARKMGIDASLVSKYRTGKRGKPTRYQQMINFCEAIASFWPMEMDEAQLPTELRQVLPYPIKTSEDFSRALFLWLGEGEILPPDKKVLPSALKVFGEKFSALLDVAGITNVQLARALNVDSSLISLYRGGVRLPSARGGTVAQISAWLAQQMQGAKQRDAVIALIGEKGGPTCSEQLEKAVAAWLSAIPEGYADVPGVESFLEKVDSFGSFALGRQVIPLEQIAPSAGNGTQPEVFFGNRGIQQAAIRYLYHVATQQQPTTLHHFSDQSTEWMLADPQYAAVWASLMVHILTSGNVFRIIHTVNRDTSELFTALENWIPLYMVGEIVPFYFRTGDTGRVRVSHFVAEELAQISGYCAAGAENQSVYRYDTDPEIVARGKAQFEALLPLCGRLMKIYKGKKDTESFDIHMNAFWSQPGDATALLPRLSLATMPEGLLDDMLHRAGVDTVRAEQIRQSRHIQEQRLHRHLGQGRLVELCVQEPADAIEGEKIVPDISPYELSVPLAYTPEEYNRHMAHIHLLEKEKPNYRFSSLPMSPFHNIKLFYKQNGEAVVYKLNSPMAAFVFANQHMCRGIEHFLLEMKKRAGLFQ